MAKEYLPNGLLLNETLLEHIDLHTWIKQIALEQPQYPQVWGFLEKSGNYFDNVLPKYPENISIPSGVERGRCHMNNFLYAETLAQEHKDIINDFRFVTGLWLLGRNKALNKEGDYFIGGHSFMTYKGSVLDCTTIIHPPHNFFKVIQRFGISFSILDTVAVFNKLKETNTLNVTPVLEAFYEKPYIK